MMIIFSINNVNRFCYSELIYNFAWFYVSLTANIIDYWYYLNNSSSTVSY